MSNPLKKIGKAVKGFVSSVGNFVKKHWKKILVIGAMVAAPYLASQAMAAGAGTVGTSVTGLGSVGAVPLTGGGGAALGSVGSSVPLTGGITGATAGAATGAAGASGSLFGDVPLTGGGFPEIGETVVNNTATSPEMMNTISEAGTATIQAGGSVQESGKMLGWLRDKITGDGAMSKLFGKAIDVAESTAEWFKKSDWAKLGAMNWMKSYGEMKARADELAAKPKYRGSVFGVDARGQVWNPETDSMVQADPGGNVPGQPQYSPYTPPVAQGQGGLIPTPSPMPANSQQVYQQVAAQAPQVGQETMSDDPSVVSAGDFQPIQVNTRGLIQHDMNRRLG